MINLYLYPNLDLYLYLPKHGRSPREFCVCGRSLGYRNDHIVRPKKRVPEIPGLEIAQSLDVPTSCKSAPEGWVGTRPPVQAQHRDVAINDLINQSLNLYMWAILGWHL